MLLIQLNERGIASKENQLLSQMVNYIKKLWITIKKMEQKIKSTQ